MKFKTMRDVVILVVFLLSFIGGINAEDCDKNLIVWEGEAVTAVGTENTFIGRCTGKNNEGIRNTFIGCAAGFSNTTGSKNTFLGYRAGYVNKSGTQNTFLGNAAGYQNTTGNNNIFIGQQAGFNNGIGTGNIFIGNTAGWSNTTGSENTFLGYLAGKANKGGEYNTFLGSKAGSSNQTGKGNTFIGYRAGSIHKSQDGNTFIGHEAGRDHDAGGDNTFIGSLAGLSNKTGSGNVFIGHEAGINETGNNKLYIANSASNVLIYGDFASRKIGILKTNPTCTLDVNGTVCAVDFVKPSDIRLKTDVKPINRSLEQIALLRGVTFHWKDKKNDNGQQLGVIAQEIEKVFPQVVSTDGSGYKSVAYSSLVAPLIEAVKELKSENDALKARLDALEKMIKN